MNRPDQNRICESPSGATLLASASALGETLTEFMPLLRWFFAGVEGVFLFWGGAWRGGESSKTQLKLKVQ
jgi:hypothetical protein